jgi:hypothetical protein
MTGDIVSIDLIINTLTVVAGLALLIERTIEVLKHSIQFAGKTSEKEQELTLGQTQITQAKEKLSELESILDEIETNGVAARSVPAESIGLSIENTPPLVAEAESGISEGHERYEAFKLVPVTSKQHDKVQMVVFYQLASLGLGIIAAEIFSIKLLSLFLSPLGPEVVSSIPGILDVVLSGVVIGGGSQPVHALIRFITERKVDTKNKVTEESSNDEILNFLPKVRWFGNNNDQWEPISYQGGVKPHSLEHRNKRGGNPLKIIYHHTAMPDHTSFQDVVDEFLVTKGWSTGYHSVIMPDGKIQPFCRWDRVGNHAKHNNNRSVGVAFHGNFHTLENDNFSNFDGSFGAKAPSEDQIDSGARQIALWAQLYDLDIELDVLPHKDVLPGHTVCPGSNFPHSLLKQKIAYYYDILQSNDFAKEDLAGFKQRPYVYV